ncbi:hypothetical protein MSMAT_2207 [Methanosarcina mazei TMA]|nr:hypothetical protein MSMAT_2207 [Methanosarcina mazei TMA]
MFLWVDAISPTSTNFTPDSLKKPFCTPTTHGVMVQSLLTLAFNLYSSLSACLFPLFKNMKPAATIMIIARTATAANTGLFFGFL